VFTLGKKTSALGNSYSSTLPIKNATLKQNKPKPKIFLAVKNDPVSGRHFPYTLLSSKWGLICFLDEIYFELFDILPAICLNPVINRLKLRL
jgi:hypothetical protein